jgi:hypothetical protein
MARSGGMPAGEVDFSDAEQSREWFQLQPRDVCIALAARSGLRVLPLIDAVHYTPDFAPRVVLPVLRACFVAWAIAKYPSWRDPLRIADAARSASAIAAHAATRAAANATDAANAAAAYAAVHAVAAAVHYADDTAAINSAAGNAAAAAEAAHNAAAGNTAAIRIDAVAIEQGRTVAEIVAAPLWLGEIPERIAEAWDDSLRIWMLKNEANNWDPWIFWYDRVLDGDPAFVEAPVLAVASLTDEEWNEEPVPAAVNRRIAALLAEHTGRVERPVSGVMAAREGEPQTEPDPAASDARQPPKINGRGNSRPAKPAARTNIGKALLERSEQVQLALVAVISLIDEKLQQLSSNPPNSDEKRREWTNEIRSYWVSGW